MSRYIVYKCPCGKIGISEIRVKIKLSARKFHCKYCNNIYPHNKVFVYKIYNLPTDARTHQRRLIVEGSKEMPIDLKTQILQLGKNYHKIQEAKTKRHKPPTKMSKTKRALLTLYELQDTHITENQIINALQEHFTAKEIDGLIELFCKEGTLILLPKRIYKVMIDKEEIN